MEAKKAPKAPGAKVKKAAANEVIYRGLGRRKSSTARVIVRPGKGQFIINHRPARDYLMSELLLQEAMLPLATTNTASDFDITANVRGGGISGQAGAIRLGIARALLEVTPDYRSKLKEKKLLTRDARIKERKKPGLRAARRAKQFSKR